jgi:hypothetical protein
MAPMFSLDVIKQAGPRIVARLVVAVHDQFGLECMEEALHRRIVVTITLAAHALPDAIAVDDFPVASAGSEFHEPAKGRPSAATCV